VKNELLQKKPSETESDKKLPKSSTEVEVEMKKESPKKKAIISNSDKDDTKSSKLAKSAMHSTGSAIETKSTTPNKRKPEESIENGKDEKKERLQKFFFSKIQEERKRVEKKMIRKEVSLIYHCVTYF